jgi:DNA-binding FadR family transcriptional regulator
LKNVDQQKRPLVLETADELRDLILDCEPDTQIGSLSEVAERLGVGIVTVQQAARILEHEGLLAVKRGPGGGYYGARPNDSALERAFATYLRIHDFGYREAFEIMILLDCEMIPAAAKSTDETLRESIAELLTRLKKCEQPEDRVQFEKDLRDALFTIAEKPFLIFLARVTMQLYSLQSSSVGFSDAELVQKWKDGRRRILQSILQSDPELARFEAERYRKMMLTQLLTTGAPSRKK